MSDRVGVPSEMVSDLIEQAKDGLINRLKEKFSLSLTEVDRCYGNHKWLEVSEGIEVLDRDRLEQFVSNKAVRDEMIERLIIDMTEKIRDLTPGESRTVEWDSFILEKRIRTSVGDEVRIEWFTVVMKIQVRPVPPMPRHLRSHYRS